MAGSRQSDRTRGSESHEGRDTIQDHMQRRIARPAPIITMNTTNNLMQPSSPHLAPHTGERRVAGSPPIEYDIPRGPFPTVRSEQGLAPALFTLISGGVQAVAPGLHMPATHFTRLMPLSLDQGHSLFNTSNMQRHSFPDHQRRAQVLQPPLQHGPPPPYPSQYQTMAGDRGQGAPPSAHVSIEESPASVQDIVKVIPPGGATLEKIIDGLPDGKFPLTEEQHRAFIAVLKSCTQKNDKVYKVKALYRSFSPSRHAEPATSGSTFPQPPQPNLQSADMPPPSAIRNGVKKSTKQPGAALNNLALEPSPQSSLKNPKEQTSPSSHKNNPEKSAFPVDDRSKGGSTATPSASPQIIMAPPAPITGTKRGAPAHEDTPAAQRQKTDNIKVGDLKATKEELRARLEQKNAHIERIKQAKKQREEAEIKRLEEENAELQRQNDEKDAVIAKLMAEEEEENAKEREQDEAEIEELNRQLAEADQACAELESGEEEADDLFME